DWKVLACATAVCLTSTLILGLVPAFQTSKIDLASALKAESGGLVGSRRKSWIRSGLVVVQVSLSFVLLVGAGLLLRCVNNMQAASPGFSTQGVLNTYVDMISAGYDPPRMRNFQDELIGRLQGITGVESASFVRMIPFGYGVYSS